MLWASLIVMHEHNCDTSLERFIREINQTAEDFTVFTNGGNYTEFGDGKDITGIAETGKEDVFQKLESSLGGNSAGFDSTDQLDKSGFGNNSNFANGTKSNETDGGDSGVRTIDQTSLDSEGLRGSLDYISGDSDTLRSSVLFGLKNENLTQDYLNHSDFRSNVVDTFEGKERDVVTNSHDFVSSGPGNVLLSSSGGFVTKSGDLVSKSDVLLTTNSDLVSENSDLVTTNGDLVIVNSDSVKNDNVSILRNIVQSSGLYETDNLLTTTDTLETKGDNFATGGMVTGSNAKLVVQSTDTIRPTPPFVKYPNDKDVLQKKPDAQSNESHQREAHFKGSSNSVRNSKSGQVSPARTTPLPVNHITTIIANKRTHFKRKSRHKVAKIDQLHVRNMTMQNVSAMKNIKHRHVVKNEKGANILRPRNITTRNTGGSRTGKTPFRTFLRTGNTDNGGPMEYSPNSKIKIYIGGLFELSQTSYGVNGRSELATAEMAIHDVNKRGILKGYELVMKHNDTKVGGFI
jgi:hypothetical protein